ncbi:MAG: hypothetical protein Q7K65_05355 [Candidatus Buchananbacteria bacterium]|nr:hypothetical protein [Candidatus Buchananbacteria bacterium]
MKEDKNNYLNDDMILNDKFLIDLIKIGTDFWLGIILSLFLYTKLAGSDPTIILLGALGGISPDPLQFLYWKTKSRFLAPLQRFHHYIQDGMHFRNRPFIGMPLQILLNIIVVSLVIKFF